MKISKLFHWLYFTVMMLPIFVIPIFALAVRSDNNFEPISIDTTGVVYQHQYNTNDINSKSDLVDGNAYLFEYYYKYDSLNVSSQLSYPFTNNFYQFLSEYYSNGSLLGYVGMYFPSIIDLNVSSGSGYTYLPYSDYYGTTSTVNSVSGYWLNIFHFDFPIISDNTIQEVWLSHNKSTDINFQYGFFVFKAIIIYHDTYVIHDSLSQPVSDDVFISFFSALPDEYNPYVRLENVGVVYNDTDVGSQMIYVSYQVVYKYFNYDNVFNFGDLYTYLVNTFFNGAVSLGFFIFWHLLIYWLLTSLLWLLFDVLIYVPQLIHRWLDKASLS